MKKIVITKENYESIMFGLLENEYSNEVAQDLFSQIEADTFLSFEWKQWSKTQYSEGLETYKREEAEFIESLVRPEEKKKGGALIRFIIPLSMAACLTLFFVLRTKEDPTKTGSSLTLGAESKETKVPEAEISIMKETNKFSDKKKGTIQTQVRVSDQPENPTPELNIPTLTEVKLPEQTPSEITPVESLKDSMNRMIQVALESESKKSKYKVTIVQERMDGLAYENTVFNEKRYTMADVMNHKDGISLSKFLNNSRSKVIRDKNSNATYIEYIAEDNSVLILTLSN